MELMLLGVLAFAGYELYRFIVRAGTEAVRAYVYLELLHIGKSTEEANFFADRAVAVPSSSLMQNAIEQSTRAYKNVHEGKKLPLVGYAYRKGLRPAMPFWYRAVALAVPETLSIEVEYSRLRPQTVSEQIVQPKHSSETSNGYKAYRQIFADEVLRLSGKAKGDVNIVEMMDDETLQRAYHDRVDPLVLAAGFCDEYHLTKETYQTYDHYYEAFVSELKRFTADAAQLTGWLSQVDPARINSSFESGVHPRLAADGYQQFMSEQSARL